MVELDLRILIRREGRRDWRWWVKDESRRWDRLLAEGFAMTEKRARRAAERKARDLLVAETTHVEYEYKWPGPAERSER